MLAVIIKSGDTKPLLKMHLKRLKVVQIIDIFKTRNSLSSAYNLLYEEESSEEQDSLAFKTVADGQDLTILKL